MNRAIPRIILGVLAVLTVTAAVVGAGATTQSTAKFAKQLFGLRSVQQVLYPTSTTLLVTGTAPDPQLAGLNDVVIGGAVRIHGTWWVRLLQSYLISFGCTNSIATKLVPGGPAIVTNCYNGGSDGQSFFTVSGVQPGSGFPVVMLADTCGQTHAVARGNDLVVKSAALSGGGHEPIQEQPEFQFRWYGNGRTGGLDSSPLSDVEFKKYCTPPDDYFPNA